jgi:putative nucleotidyltransferase with HDIG domain
MEKQTAASKLGNFIGLFKTSVYSRQVAAFALFSLVSFVLAMIIKINLILAFFLAVCGLYLVYLYHHIRYKPTRFLHIIFLFVIVFAQAAFLWRQGDPLYFFPFAVVPMLAALLFNELLASLVLVVVSALTVAVVFGNQLYLALFLLISGLTSVMLVFGARRRITIIQSGIIIGLVQTICLILIYRFNPNLVSNYLYFFINGAASGVIVLGILPVFEYLFKTITNISLLELSDFNQPLLHRMMLEAPGTYHHSLIVGNLSEAACELIGANSLLARIGSYYHDVGKLEKPEYFSENQDIKESKHDNLSPTMSKLVIMNHVKEGMELAKRYRLSPALISFIQQHHGNSLVYYFYRRALENVDEDKAVIEDGFRYPGPKPRSRETAVVLLADSVEAATRALKEPAPAKIEELVHKVINNKFIDGQLDECDLTLRDLEKIASVFIRILSSIYRARISYPESSVENNHKKSPKENSHLSDKDKENSS